MKFSCITGSMGNIGDRFLLEGYKESISPEDRLDAISKIDCLTGVELCYDINGYESNADIVNAALKKLNIFAAGTNGPLAGQRIFKFGSLTNPDPDIRKKALQYARDTIDFTRKTGGQFVNLWLGQDGFDYSFQTDYTKQWKLMVEGLREICDYAPDLKIALEFKQREPRNRCFFDHPNTSLLVACDVERKNIGATIDLGHVFQCGANIAQVIEVCAGYEMLYHIHINDNYGTWDDDLILGSVRHMEYIELCYSLRKVAYKGWLSVDIFPYRENSIKAAEESILNLIAFDKVVDRIGFDRLTKLIEANDPVEVVKTVRETLFEK